MPELIFVLDRGLERGTAVLGLLRELEQERRRRESDPAEAATSSSSVDQGTPDAARPHATSEVSDGHAIE
jgi:ribosome-binding factor A